MIGPFLAATTTEDNEKGCDDGADRRSCGCKLGRYGQGLLLRKGGRHDKYE